MVVSSKTDLRFPESGQQGHGARIIHWASMICVICFIGGVQLLCTGVIGQYIGKVYMETKHRPRYIISDRTYEKQNMDDK